MSYQNNSNQRNSGQKNSNQRNSGSNRNSKPAQNANEYYPLTTTGFGFINFLQEHQSDNGFFTTCSIAAKTGPKSAEVKEYRYFDVTVRGQKTEDLLWDFQDDLMNEQGSAMVEFVLSDIKPKTFYRGNGDLVAGIDAYLIAINRIWLNGEVIYDSSQEQNNINNNNDYQPEQAPRNGQSNNRSAGNQNQRQGSSNARQGDNGSNRNGRSNSNRGGRNVA